MGNKQNETPTEPVGEPIKQSKFFAAVEKIGNKFPQPFLLFIYLCIALLIIAALMEGKTFTVPGTEGEMVIVSLLNGAGLRYMISNLFGNFGSLSFVPLIIIFSLAVGVGEQAGLYQSVIVRAFRRIPDKLLVFVFLFVAINSNLISDASLIIMPPLGAALFIMKGKNPALAISLAFAGFLAGLSANMLIAGTDVLSAGITESALGLLPITKDLTITAASNWYFMAVSAILLTIVGTFVTIRFIEPRINQDKSIVWDKSTADASALELSAEARRGLKFAGVATFVYWVLVILTVLPGGPMRNQTTGALLPTSPFISNIVTIFAVYFLIIGVAYGFGSGAFKNSLDVANAMGKGVEAIAGVLATYFFCAQFLSWFSYTNLAPYLATSAARFLEATNFVGVPLIVAMVIITALINFFIGTVSTKWMVMAPIMVPMFALLGYHPAFAQVVYRVGDAITNTVNPISIYIPMILVYMKKYKADAGIGTIISYQIPLCIGFTIVWTLQLVVWFLLDLPVGPLAPILLQ